jgi:hypothetical protein
MKKETIIKYIMHLCDSITHSKGKCYWIAIRPGFFYEQKNKQVNFNE